MHEEGLGSNFAVQSCLSGLFCLLHQFRNGNSSAARRQLDEGTKDWDGQGLWIPGTNGRRWAGPKTQGLTISRPQGGSAQTSSWMRKSPNCSRSQGADDQSSKWRSFGEEMWKTSCDSCDSCGALNFLEYVHVFHIFPSLRFHLEHGVAFWPTFYTQVSSWKISCHSTKRLPRSPCSTNTNFLMPWELWTWRRLIHLSQRGWRTGTVFAGVLASRHSKLSKLLPRAGGYCHSPLGVSWCLVEGFHSFCRVFNMLFALAIIPYSNFQFPCDSAAEVLALFRSLEVQEFHDLTRRQPCACLGT